MKTFVSLSTLFAALSFSSIVNAGVATPKHFSQASVDATYIGLDENQRDCTIRVVTDEAGDLELLTFNGANYSNYLMPVPGSGISGKFDSEYEQDLVELIDPATVQFDRSLFRNGVILRGREIENPQVQIKLNLQGRSFDALEGFRYDYDTVIVGLRLYQTWGVCNDLQKI